MADAGVPLENVFCSGVWAVHIHTGNTIGLLKFTGGVQEIFAVQALHGCLFPEILHDGEFLQSSYALPDEALREVRFSEPKAASADGIHTASPGVAS